MLFRVIRRRSIFHAAHPFALTKNTYSNNNCCTHIRNLLLPLQNQCPLTFISESWGAVDSEGIGIELLHLPFAVLSPHRYLSFLSTHLLTLPEKNDADKWRLGQNDEP